MYRCSEKKRTCRKGNHVYGKSTEWKPSSVFPSGKLEINVGPKFREPKGEAALPTIRICWAAAFAAGGVHSALFCRLPPSMCVTRRNDLQRQELFFFGHRLRPTTRQNDDCRGRHGYLEDNSEKGDTQIILIDRCSIGREAKDTAGPFLTLLDKSHCMGSDNVALSPIRTRTVQPSQLAAQTLKGRKAERAHQLAKARKSSSIYGTGLPTTLFCNIVPHFPTNNPPSPPLTTPLPFFELLYPILLIPFLLLSTSSLGFTFGVRTALT